MTIASRLASIRGLRIERDAPLSNYTRFNLGGPASLLVDAPFEDAFIAVRQIAFGLWYTGMAQVNPAFAARLDRVHRWSMSMLDRVGGPAA